MSSDITPQISDKRRSFSPAFKMNIAKLALAGELSVSVIARQNDINTNQVFRWTREFQRQQVYWVKQALHLPSSGSESKLLPVKIQNSLLPVSEVSVDDTAVTIEQLQTDFVSSPKSVCSCSIVSVRRTHLV